MENLTASRLRINGVNNDVGKFSRTTPCSRYIQANKMVFENNQNQELEGICNF